MRAIKFRGWYIERKMMFYNIQELYDGYGIITDREGKELDIYDAGGQNVSSFGHWLESEEFVVMQYTGLKDTNDKEIYEGDIMKTESGICVVKWYDKGACFRWMFAANSESPLNYDDRGIIGNIYENPNLIK